MVYFFYCAPLKRRQAALKSGQKNTKTQVFTSLSRQASLHGTQCRFINLLTVKHSAYAPYDWKMKNESWVYPIKKQEAIRLRLFISSVYNGHARRSGVPAGKIFPRRNLLFLQEAGQASCKKSNPPSAAARGGAGTPRFSSAHLVILLTGNIFGSIL